jgi:hypothetical protein
LTISGAVVLRSFLFGRASSASYAAAVDLLSPAVQTPLEHEPPPLRAITVTSRRDPQWSLHPALVLVSALQRCGPGTLDNVTLEGSVGVAADVVAHLARRRGVKRLEISDDRLQGAADTAAFAAAWADKRHAPFADVETLDI